MLDLVLAGGTVVDGTGAPAAVADVGVRDGRIVALGAVEEEAARTVDCSGKVICPGFVKTRMTAVNRFPMPLLMEADAAAGVIRRGLARNRGRIAFPWPLAGLVWLLAALPPGLVDSLLARLPRKH